jgi:RimJ/RimL family protein N-acetyltransferase
VQVQLTPIDGHPRLTAALDAAGWGTKWPSAVLRGRRAGLGTAIVRALVAWSGAREAYLEVERRNAPALALYDRLGFALAYDYVHRFAP